MGSSASTLLAACFALIGQVGCANTTSLPQAPFRPLTPEELKAKPEELRRRPGPDLEPYYRVERRARRAPITAGVILAAPAYVISVMVAANNRFANGAQFLVLPSVGPFLAAFAPNRYGCGFRPPTTPEDCNTPIVTEGLIIDGVLQTAGIALIVVGELAKRKVWVRIDVEEASIQPILMPHGLGVAGRF